MKRKLIKGLLTGLLLISSLIAGRAQWGAYHFQRELKGVEPGWQEITLPDAMYRHIRPDLHDLRIKGIDSQGDTLEAPYLIRWPANSVQIAPKSFQVINRSRRANTFFATLTTADPKPINRIVLDFANTNFDWRVRLEGSHNQREWYRILNHYRILAFSGPSGDYNFSTLHFPETNYPYYRIAINSPEAITLNGANFLKVQTSDVMYRSYPIAQQQIRVNKERKRTELELHLSTPVPVSRLQLAVSDTFDYYRPIRIELLTDSTRTESGWTYRYSQVYRGILSSLETPVFNFGLERTYGIRVFIDNQDNIPLQIGTPQILGAPPVMIARFSQTADYQLLYGWPEAPAPRYDLARFANKIPEEVSSIQPGPEVQLKPDLEVHGPFITNQAWLWAVMIGVIGLLGWFSIRMMKNG